MTLEYFKGQLYYSLLSLKPARRTELGILETGVQYEDQTALRVIRAVNLADQGRDEKVLKEDILYAVWDRGGYDSMIYWPVRELYDYYQKEGWQGVLPELITAICQEKAEGLPQENDSWLKHRSGLILRPVSSILKREEMTGAVYWLKGDIALMLYYLVYDDRENMMSLKMGRELTEKWGKKDDVLLTGALLNSFARMPPRLFQGQDCLDYYDEEYGVFMPGEEGIPLKTDFRERIQGIIGYRLTTTKRVNGAIAVFYPGVKERLAELFGGDYYVGFTSVHEAVIHPVLYKKLSDMKAAIHHNNALLNPADVLSNQVFRYVQVKGELVEV